MIGHTPDQVAALASLQRPKRGKYRAKATVVDGIRFASKKEAARYQHLILLQKAGEIYELSVQPEFKLYAAGRSWDTRSLLGVYRADFRYREGPKGILVIEDVKGGRATKTALYRWKKKHVEAQYGITILET